MEISQQFLIDMALNMGGYVLAGLLGVVVYAMFRRQRPVSAAVKPELSEPEDDKPGQPQPEQATRRIEFIKLDEHRLSAADKTNYTGRRTDGSTADRRNRAEIIRIARTMLNAGTPHEKIKRLLPISDAELSLLGASKS